jgi:TPR repeat protein
MAAEQGDSRAQHNLGLMYGEGRGVPQDYVLAHMWFSLSAENSSGEIHDDAVQHLDVAESRMTPTQIAEAERLAREWLAQHQTPE